MIVAANRRIGDHHHLKPKMKAIGGVMKRFLTRSIRIFGVALMLGLVCMAPASANKTVLRFAHPYAPMHPQQVHVFEPWAKQLSQATDGEVTVRFIPGGALGKPGQAYTAVQNGVCDITFDIQDYSPGRFPLTSVIELPFMVTSAEKGSVALWKTYADIPEFQAEYPGVKMLLLNVHSPGAFATVKKPVREIADLSGMKIRTASAFVTEALKVFNAVPVTMSIVEVYTALERGVVDGTVAPYDGITTFKLEDHTKYVTPVNFYTMTFYVAMNEKTYNRLPAKAKKFVDANSGEALSRISGRQNEEQTIKDRKKCLDNGVQEILFTADKMNELTAKTMQMREKWVADMEAKGLPGKLTLDTMLKYLNE
jgi:TRAP-type C4-dicarboxylate transport system substrate-binding protein